MINILLIVLLFIFLSYKNILLLNEESLILLCFISFVSLVLNKFGTSINASLTSQSKDIETILKQSLKQSSLLLQEFLLLSQKPKKLVYKFYKLGGYYYNLVSVLGNLLPKYKELQLNTAYKNRLIFLNKVEQQTIKLLAVIVVKKLGKITKLKQFYSSNLKTNYFLCLKSINLREYIHLITPNSK
uniref:ATP synthase B chain n=1 Tax=Corallina ferreyrae TaxID=2547422 RepID=A0A482CHG0_9FLOR|nr:ATP synthase B chain precursor [Corallina ferreyrae]QBL75547.1 ATP synthase B chain precursor [Corallina ferreyrae]